MNKKVFGLTAMTVVLFLVSCSKENGTEQTTSELILGKASLGMATKASLGYEDYTGDFKINLDAVSGKYTAINGQVFSFDGGDNVWKGTTPVYLSSASTSIRAWAPTTVTASNPVTAPNVFALAPSLTVTNPFVYSPSYTVNATSNSVALIQLNHAYAKVTFKFTSDSSYPGAGSFSSLVLHGTPGSASIDISTNPGTVTPAADADLTYISSATTLPTEGVAAIVVPKAAASLTLSCTVDGTTYSNKTVSAISALQAGKNYTITLSASGTELFVQNVEIQQWEDVSGGTVTLQ